MPMLEHVFHMTDMMLLISLSFLFIFIAIFCVFLIRRFIPHDLRNKDTAAIGYISTTIGMIYGVLVGLTALYLFNNISATSNIVQQEANAAANLYRHSQWLKEPSKTALQLQIKTYLQKAIQSEWPSMREGKSIDEHAVEIISDMEDSIHTYSVSNPQDTFVLYDMLNDIKALNDAHEQRIQMSTSQLSTEVWIVIIIGSLLTMMINFLFDMNMLLHAITSSALGLMVAAMLFLIITVDRPFQGEFVVEPQPLQSILQQIEKQHP